MLATGCVSLLLLPKQVNSAPRSDRRSVSTFIVLRDLPGAISSYTESIITPLRHHVTLLCGQPVGKEGDEDLIFYQIWNTLSLHFTVPACVVCSSRISTPCQSKRMARYE